jgi:outer membrane protein OmpU
LFKQYNKRINMNNLKKIGLSALAGSLVAFSANAGELSVSGSAEFTYTDNDGTAGNNLTGNPYGAQQAIAFTGSGDVGFGELTIVRVINDTGTENATSYATLDMGDLGTLSFDSDGYAGVGYAANDDVLPTAYEEIWTGSTGDSGVAGAGSSNTLGYANSFGPLSFSVGYQKNGAATNQSESTASGAGITGSTTDVYVSAAVPGIDGLTIGLGHSDISQNSTTLLDADSTYTGMNVNYSAGPVAVGYRYTQANVGTAATASEIIDAWSIAFNVNENFAVSYGQQDTEFEAIGATASTTEEVKGINASYTVGAASIRLLNSKANDVAGVAATENEHTEIGVVLSF